MIDLTGQQFGNYRLVRRLGVGGFASVYLGQHVRVSSMQAAIKILDLRDVDEQQFHQEAETTASLVHPNIVRLLDFDIQQETPFLVLDYAPGGSLRARHPKGSRVPLATVIQYIKELAPALQHAHDQNILHRDIKPDNILIGRQGELLLSDFGISLLSRTGRTSLHSSTSTGGTPYYMAPEQFRGKPSKASDQYALATVVYEWLCGTTPFYEGDFIQLGFQHTYEPVPPLKTSVPELPPDIEAIVIQALAKQPQDRFSSIQAFAEALETASKASSTGARLQNRSSFIPISADKTVIGRRASIGRLLYTYTGHAGEVLKLAWSPDGEYLASGSVDNTAQVWHANTGQLFRTYTGHDSWLIALAWSPNGEYIASGSVDDTVHVWRVIDGLISRRYTKHANSVLALAWSPNGEYIASGSDDDTVHVWNANNGRRRHTYTGHTRHVNTLAWSPNGTRLASGSGDHTVQIWEATSGRLLYSYTGHTNEVNTLAWSPDGTRLASSSDDGTVQIWQASSGRPLHTYALHTDSVLALGWSPDGTRLASGSSDHTVQIWKAENGQLLHTYTGHADEVSALAWSPDGTRLASGSDDQTVQVWQAM